MGGGGQCAVQVAGFGCIGMVAGLVSMLHALPGLPLRPVGALSLQPPPLALSLASQVILLFPHPFWGDDVDMFGRVADVPEVRLGGRLHKKQGAQPMAWHELRPSGRRRRPAAGHLEGVTLPSKNLGLLAM